MVNGQRLTLRSSAQLSSGVKKYGAFTSSVPIYLSLRKICEGLRFSESLSDSAAYVLKILIVKSKFVLFLDESNIPLQGVRLCPWIALCFILVANGS